MVICFDFRHFSVVTSCGLVNKAIIREPQGQWFSPCFILAMFYTGIKQDTEPQVAHYVNKLFGIKACDKCKDTKPLNPGHYVLNPLNQPHWTHIISEAQNINKLMCNYLYTTNISLNIHIFFVYTLHCITISAKNNVLNPNTWSVITW